jgi:hypothetical protein
MKRKGKDILEHKANKDLPGYPEYPPEDDIYSQGIEEEELDPEIILQQPDPDEPVKKAPVNKKAIDKVDKGLDIPGAELDDQQEEIGTEDEENNYYSLGGDDHENLEEDQGDNYQ